MAKLKTKQTNADVIQFINTIADIKQEALGKLITETISVLQAKYK